MGQFKAIATLTWKVEAENEEECLNLVRRQIDTFLKRPYLDDFRVQLDVASMKARNKLEHIAFFPAEEILSMVTDEDVRTEFVVNNKSYWVKMNSDRYHVFKQNRKCCACGIIGETMVLDLNPGDSSPHFNLYAIENGQLLLLTKDHKIPKSKGGEDRSENFFTTCAICNNLKGNSDITYEQVAALRKIYNNPDRLSKKELRTLLHKTREEMEIKNRN